jgi:hypothetical protein
MGLCITELVRQHVGSREQTYNCVHCHCECKVQLIYDKIGYGHGKEGEGGKKLRQKKLIGR